MGRKKLGVVGRSYTITFDQALFVSKFADAKGCPESHVVRMAIQEVLNKYKMGVFSVRCCKRYSLQKVLGLWYGQRDAKG